MRIRYFIIPAMLVAGVVVGMAEETSEQAVVIRPPMQRNQRNQRKGESMKDSILFQTMLLRVLENAEARDKIGLDPDVHEALVTAFEAIDKQVQAKQSDLGYLQATQAKLILDGADEADVMAAVDAVWKVRGEIAKLQTAKLLKVKGLLTEEQVQRLDEARHEIFRAQRIKQLREGGSGRPQPQGRRPKREQPAATDE